MGTGVFSPELVAEIVGEGNLNTIVLYFSCGLHSFGSFH